VTRLFEPQKIRDFGNEKSKKKIETFLEILDQLDQLGPINQLGPIRPTRTN